jgi:hypothetical protein
MKTKLIFTILAFTMMFAFQNCGQEYAAATYNISSNRGNAGDPGKVEVGPAVWPRTDSTISNPVPLSVSRAALPEAIDFNSNPNFDENSAITSWGAWLSAWHDLPADAQAVLGQPKFLFRLDIFKGTVTDLTSDEVVYTLGPKEAAKLASIFSSSILANAREFSATASCTPSDAEGYATLETDYGLFDLGAGAPCAVVDLFKNDGSGKSGGLNDFLKKIQSKIN